MMTRCRDCDDHVREIANMADELAFWAYQAKWHYAQSNGMGDYDALPRLKQEQIDELFRQARIAENKSRINAEPPRDIGGT